MKEIEKTQSSALEGYEKLVSRVDEVFPRVLDSLESFNKSSSQLKTVTLDINDLTDIGTAKHILANISRTKQALRESEIFVRRTRVTINRKESELDNLSGFDLDDALIDISELKTQLEEALASQRGAVRKISYLLEQYDAICTRLDVDVITEKMYEEDQAKYHVMRAFSQALAAARSRGGVIDEGNFIYFQDLGINGAAAQREVTFLLEAEQEVLNNQKTPTFEMQRSWLEAVGEKYSGEVRRYVEFRGLIPSVPELFAQSILEVEQ